MNDSHKHVCSKNDKHTAWSPDGWMVGEPCLNFVHGRPCGGRYVAIGAGARAANELANA